MSMTPTTPVAFDTQPNPATGFLGLYTEEDMGLKALLSGVTVTDLNATWEAPRPVPVWFHNPEREERRITYPSIIIAFDGERVAHEREHRGYVQLGYRYLQNVPFDNAHPVFQQFPIPMDFDYTVTVQARINQHISQMSSFLALGPLHPRFAGVVCPGGTVRRLEVLGTTRTTTVEADKRLFRQIYRVRIPTEIEDPVGISTTRVAKVVLSVVEIESGQLLFGQREITSTASRFQLPDIDTGQYQSQTAGE
jgi:hypothetical protein